MIAQDTSDRNTPHLKSDGATIRARILAFLADNPGEWVPTETLHAAVYDWPADAASLNCFYVHIRLARLDLPEPWRVISHRPQGYALARCDDEAAILLAQADAENATRRIVRVLAERRSLYRERAA